VVEMLGNLLGGAEDIGQVGMAVAAARRGAHRDEHGVDALHRLLQIHGEGQAAGGDVAGDQIVQAGLVDRNFAALQPLDLAGVLVDASDVHAEFRKAGAGDQADIARADHRYAHRVPLISLKRNPVCLWDAQVNFHRGAFLMAGHFARPAP